jgi:hypothetical protein
MTQGVMNASSVPQLFWTAATNEQGEVTREYDLLYCDAMNFSDALTSQWKRLASGFVHTMVDTGGLIQVDGGGDMYLTPPSELINTMRFYRAAAKDRWLTNRNPRIATEEIYGVKTFRLYRGQNWVALPFMPDSNSAIRVFGNSLYGTDEAATATKISWYHQLTIQESKRTIWMDAVSQPPVWRYSVPEVLWDEEANQAEVPVQEGFIIEVPDNAPEPQIITFIGRIPTNALEMGMGAMGKHNLAGFNQPRWVHPSQLGLLEAGFKGSDFPMGSDRIWTFNRVTQRAKPDIWYRSTDGTWRYNITPNFPVVQSWERPFGPDDAIVILTSPTNTTYWTWTNRVLYTPPTRTMSP